jgi:hypothetical protein
MSADTTPVYAAAQTRPRSALAKLTLTEARLLLREPVALFWGLAFPMALLAVMGLASSGRNPISAACGWSPSTSRS